MNEVDNWHWTAPYHNVTHFIHADKNHDCHGTLVISDNWIEGYCYSWRAFKVYYDFTYRIADYRSHEEMLADAKNTIARHIW